MPNQIDYHGLAVKAVDEFVEHLYIGCSFWRSNFYKYVKEHQEEVAERLTDYLTVTEDGTVYDRDKTITALDTNGTLLAHNILDILKTFRRGDVRQAGGLSRTLQELGFVQMDANGVRENNRYTLIGDDYKVTRESFLKMFCRATAAPEGAKCNDYWEADIHRIYIFCVYVELAGLHPIRRDYHTHSQTGRKKVVANNTQTIVWRVHRREYYYHEYPSSWSQSINDALAAIPYATYDNLNLKTKAGETIDTLDCRVAYGVEFEIGSNLADDQIFQIDMTRNGIMTDGGINSIRMHDGSLGGGTETIFVPASADNFIYIMKTMSQMVERTLSTAQKGRDVSLASTHTTVSIAFPDTDLGRAITDTRVKNTTFQARLLVLMDKIKHEFTLADIIDLFGRYFTGYAEAPTVYDLEMARSAEQSAIDGLRYNHCRAASVHGLRSEGSWNEGRDNGASMYELRLPNRKCNPYFIRDFGFITMLLDYNYFNKADLYDKAIGLCRKYLQD